MANQEIKSKFLLEFEERGAQRVRRAVDDVNKGLSRDKLAGGMEDLDRQTKRNQRQMSGLSKELRGVTKSLQTMSRAVRHISKMADELKRAQTNAKKTGDEVQRTAAAARRGSFSQGVAQGLGFGPYLQRGPGMFRQAAGMGVGGAARGFFASPVRGAAAIAQGMSSIPGGGLAAAPFQNALASFQSAMGQQRALMALGGGGRLNVGAGRSAFARIMAEQFTPTAIPTSVPPRNIAARSNMGGGPQSAEEFRVLRGMLTQDLRRFGQERQASFLESRSFADQQRMELKARQERVRTQNAAGYSRFVADRQERAEAARRRASANAGSRLQSLGVRQGFMPQESLQFMEQAGLSGLDPSLDAAAPSFGAMLGIQRLGFGGAAEAGAFARAERRGGVQGVSRRRGGAGQAINETIGRAMAQGLDRSEVRELLRQLNAGQDRFFTTGIPFARDSMMDLGDALRGSLGTGARSMRAAQAITQGAQQVGGQGPQNTAQALLLRQVATQRGFGTSGEGIFQAMSELEQGRGPTGGEISGMLGGFRTGGGAMGAFARKQVLQSAFPGFQLTAQEAGGLNFRGQSTRGASLDVQQRAEGITSGFVRRQAGQELTRVGTGLALGKSVQDFEDGMISSAKMFKELAPTIGVISQFSKELAENMPALGRAVQNFIDRFGDDTGPSMRLRTDGG